MSSHSGKLADISRSSVIAICAVVRSLIGLAPVQHKAAAVEVARNPRRDNVRFNFDSENIAGALTLMEILSDLVLFVTCGISETIVCSRIREDSEAVRPGSPNSCEFDNSQCRPFEVERNDVTMHRVRTLKVRDFMVASENDGILPENATVVLKVPHLLRLTLAIVVGVSPVAGQPARAVRCLRDAIA